MFIKLVCLCLLKVEIHGNEIIILLFTTQEYHNSVDKKI